MAADRAVVAAGPSEYRSCTPGRGDGCVNDVPPRSPDLAVQHPPGDAVRDDVAELGMAALEDRLALAVDDGHGGVGSTPLLLAVGTAGPLDPGGGGDVVDDGVEGVLERLRALELGELGAAGDVERPNGGGEADAAAAEAALEGRDREGEMEGGAEEELAGVEVVAWPGRFRRLNQTVPR